MKSIQFSLLAVCLFLISACSGIKRIAPVQDDGIFSLTVVQVNDVYEIAPVNNGTEGGLARVASLKKQELQKNPHTILIMAGDFISPSVFNSLKYNGNRIQGAQMIDAMNAAQFDYVGFGNHEFDFNQDVLQARIDESEFEWISSNTYLRNGLEFQSFYKQTPSGKKFTFTRNDTLYSGLVEQLPESKKLVLTDADGTEVTIGLFSLLLPFNQAEYVIYRDYMEAARMQYNQLAEECDAVIAITHLNMDDDRRLAEELPGLAMILGGHEHDHRYEKVGNVAITKAHANARTAYVNHLTIDKNRGSISTTEKLVSLNEEVPLDSATDVVVQKWMNIASENFSSSGFDPGQIILEEGEPFDVLETSIRSKSTNFSKMVVKAMENAAPKADAAIVNSGSMRLDDMLSPPISEYDILRAMPYGGFIQEADITGELLKQVLDVGIKNRNEGGFLQFSENIHKEKQQWLIDNAPIDSEATYRIAFADFLLLGLEENLDFLNAKNPAVLNVFPQPEEEDALKNDIRSAVIYYLINIYDK